MTTVRLEVHNSLANIKEGMHFHELNKLTRGKIESVEEASFYKIKMDNTDFDFLDEIFVDPILERAYTEERPLSCDWFVEVGYLPGVTDNTGHSSVDAIKLMGHDSEVYTGRIFLVKGDISREELLEYAQKYMANTLIQSLSIHRKDELVKLNRFKDVPLPLVKMEHGSVVSEFNLDLSDKELEDLSLNRCLALTLDEFHHIKSHYENADVIVKRKERGLPKWPTDVELEVIAQSWSEHCKHKIFSADIDYSENVEGDHKKIGSKKVISLYKSFIKKVTHEVERDRNIDWLKSVFSDNAGVVRFDKNIDLCIKAETHNSPSALDPYGGALTGILGVNRDILGVGMGARPIANTDVFCFASPSWPLEGMESKMPKGLMAPMQLLKGVHKGVEDGGNKSGIPTVNGAIYFDQDYAGKPLVFCGTVGVMPHRILDSNGHNRDCFEKYTNKGDAIFMVGGAIGADGIHGATFSSLELNESSPATAVQIGDPFTQKRVLDFLLEARDRGLFSGLTDNGAGGLSSSVGEMCIATNGAKIDLSLCSVKYPGLSPWELMISESQERMTFSVSREDCKEFTQLAKEYSICVDEIGEFTDSGYLDVYYGDELTASLDLHFLHESLPAMKLKAVWNGPENRETWVKAPLKLDLPKDLSEVVLNLLSSDNIRSKEYWVRQYDHEVQGATIVKPFSGESGNSPNDAGVIWLSPHGGEEDNAVAIACGLAPRLSLYDPYYMAQFSVDEAVRNAVSQGGDIDHLCLLDNFCWPDPVKSSSNTKGDYKLGQLVRACQGLYDICKTYGTPLVSGKDSMKNDFRGKDLEGNPLQISILPTLLVTAMAKTDIKRISSSHYKSIGDYLFLLGPKGSGLLGSEFYEKYNIDFDLSLPEIDPKKNYELYKKIFKLSDTLGFESVHDISDGGLLCSAIESCFGQDLGIKLNFSSEDILSDLFNESPGRFIVSVSADKRDLFLKEFSSEGIEIGRVIRQKKIIVENKRNVLFERDLKDFKESFTREWE